MTLEGTIKHGVELEAGAESDSTLELTLHGGLRVTLASCDCDEVVIAFGPIGSYVDMSGYYTRAQTDTLLSGKADKATTYTKAEVDEMISHVDIDMDDAPTEGSGNAVSSGGVFTALSGKVDKQAGKGLSSNDYTDAEKTKLASVASGAEANVQSDWSQSDSSADDYIKNKPTIPTVPSNVSAFTNDAGYLTEHQSLGNYYTKSEINSALGSKQDTLVSGTNIKTINNNSLLGSGNVNLCPYAEYADETALRADTTQRNGTIGFENVTHRFFIYHSQFSEWLQIAQGQTSTHTSFEYMFDIVFTH